MHNQTYGVAYLSYSFSSSVSVRHEYKELLVSLEKLIIYMENQSFEESISSLLSPCIGKIKNVLVRINSATRISYIYLSELIPCIEKVSIIIKLFSKFLKLEDAIARLHSTSQDLMGRMILEAPKSTGIALKKFMKGNTRGLTLNTPFYIAREAFIISKNNQNKIGKELEYAKNMGNKSRVYLISEEISAIKEERVILENIRDISCKISEQYSLLVNEAQNTISIIEIQIAKLNRQIDKFMDNVIKRSSYKSGFSKFGTNLLSFRR